MAFKIRRGTDAERLTITPAQGELIYTTDTKRLYVGDGTTQGGIPASVEQLSLLSRTDLLYPQPFIANPSEYVFVDNDDGLLIGDPDTGTGKLVVITNTYDSNLGAGITLSQHHNISDAVNLNLIRTRGSFANKQAVIDGDDIGDINFVTSDGIQHNISVGTITVQVDGPLGTSQSAVPAKFIYSLRDANAVYAPVLEIKNDSSIKVNNITSLTTNSDLQITKNGTGGVKINGMKWPGADGSSSNLLTTDGAGTLSWTSGYATTTYVDTAISNLVGGAPAVLDTLKELADAINNDSTFGGNILAAIGNKVSYTDVQSLTGPQKLVAQTNIGLTAAALQSDWNQTDNTASDFIKNKPTIGAAQIQSDWTQSNNSALDFIKNKPSIPNLNAVAQDILPTTTVTYDIGSPSKRFRDIYLSSNTIYLGETALGVDPVKGLQVKTFGGGEGYGAGSVEWLATGAAYGVLHALKFNGVDISHPLYTYLSNLKIGDQIKEAVPPNNPTFVPPADFLLTITEPVQFGNIVPDGFGGQLYDEVVIPVNQSRTTGSTYYVFYVEFRNNPITGLDNIPDPDGILPTATQAGWPEYGDLGINTLRGDQTVFIRPSWNRTPTVDFQFKEDGTLQLPPGGDIVDSAGVSVLGGGGTGSLGNNNTISHINLDGVPYAGAAVNFVHTDNGTEVDILIPDDGAGAGVGITRDTDYGIYNPYREGIWDDTVSPGGTEWNIDGWLDLTDVTTRTYQPLYAAFGSGGLGNKIVGTECVMYLPDNGKYYTVKFTQWTQGGNGGGFAYTRRELDLTSLEEGITFADGTTLKSAEGIGRVKLTAPNDRRIEQAYGYKEVTVTPITTTSLTATASRNGVNENSIWIDSTATTIDDILNNTGAAGIWQFNTIEFSLDNSTWYRWGGGTGNSGDERAYGLILPANILNYNQGDTIYFRYNTGGEPVVWWNKNDLPSGSGNFRGAKIDYHAFTGEGTIIGTIHIVDDDSEENITHTEVSSGSTDSENDDLWLIQNEGTISYRRIDGEGKTLKVQWSATVFYGSELYD